MSLPYIIKQLYYNKQLLSVSDFERERDFHINWRDLQTSLILSAGVVTGLTASVSSGATITLSQGVAVDSSGRFLVARDLLSWNDSLIDGSSGSFAINLSSSSYYTVGQSRTWLLLLTFNEEPVSLTANESRQTPLLGVVESGSSVSSDAVQIASVTVTATSTTVNNVPSTTVTATVNADGAIAATFTSDLVPDLDAAILTSGTLVTARIPDLDASKISAGTFGTARIPDLDAAKITAGTLGTARIPDLDAAKITAGTFGTARIPDLDAAKITAGTLGTARVPDLDAAKIATGTLGTARIPDLDAAKITTGTLGTALIPDLDAAKITTGTLNTARISELDASKITTGTLPAGRLPELDASKITTGVLFPFLIPDLDASKVATGTLNTDRIPDLDASKITSGMLDAGLLPAFDASRIMSGTLESGRIPSLDASKITTGILASDVIPLLEASKIAIGTLATAQIPALDASKITTGTLDPTLLPALNAGTIATGILNSDRIPELDASKITSGTFGTDRIPELDAGKLTSGTLSTARIPDLDAAKLTTGTLATARIPDLDASKLATGTLATARIPDLDASKLTSGTLSTARIPDLDAAKLTTGTLATARIPDLAASKITSGTFGTDQIPSISASKITSGTLGVERIPDLAASKLTSGTLDVARIPSLDASKLTSGTLDVARLPSIPSTLITGTLTTTQVPELTTLSGDIDELTDRVSVIQRAGISEGLSVTGNTGDTSVTVSAGTAFDSSGRKLILSAATTVAVIATGSDFHDPDLLPLIGRICYLELSSTATTFSDASPTLACSATRNASSVLLATIITTNGQIFRLNLTGRVAVSAQMSLDLTASGALKVGGAATLSSTLSFGYSWRQMLNLWDTSYGLGVQDSTLYLRTNDGIAFFAGGSHSDSSRDPGTGGSLIASFQQSGSTVASPLTVSGTTTLSSSLSVSGATTLSSSLSVSGATTLSTLSFGSSMRQMLNLWDTGYGLGIQNSTLYLRTDNGIAFFVGGTHSDTQLSPGTGGSLMASFQASGINMASPLNVSAATTLSTLNVTAATTLSSSLSVSGATTLSTLSFGSSTRQMLNLYGTSYGLGIQNNTLYLRTDNGIAFFAGGTHSDTQLSPGTGGSLIASFQASGINITPPLNVTGATKLSSTLSVGTSSGFKVDSDGNVTIGSSSTSNSLSVNGRTAVVANSETLRMVRGTVRYSLASGTNTPTGTATITEGAGFTITKMGKGIIDVLFNSGTFSSIPTVTVTALYPNEYTALDSLTGYDQNTNVLQQTAVITELGTNGAGTAYKFRVKTGTYSGTAGDLSFTFVAVGT